MGGWAPDSDIYKGYHATNSQLPNANCQDDSPIYFRPGEEGYHVRMPKITSFCLLVMLLGVLLPTRAPAATCEQLTSLTLRGGTVTMAQTVAPGAFTPPAGRAGGPGGAANPFAKLDAFCRVAATLKPGSQSDIKAEVWLPLNGWNGKLEVVGNGGFAGTISYAAMATALAAGYATASTDTGHTGPSSNTFANNDVLIDFAHRAIHETTVAAKTTVDGFYGSAPKQSYSTDARPAVVKRSPPRRSIPTISTASSPARLPATPRRRRSDRSGSRRCSAIPHRPCRARSSRSCTMPS
jgi:tannase/feruloyl esterase